MRVVEISTLSNGAHRSNIVRSTSVPEGWAVIPNAIDTPNFPFGEITVAEIDGVPTVTSWAAGVMPEPAPTPEPEPTAQDDTDALVVDHEYRITMLELGLTEEGGNA